MVGGLNANTVRTADRHCVENRGSVRVSELESYYTHQNGMITH